MLDENGNPTGTNFTAWTPIGTDTQPFTGTLDGNGHTISGLYCNTPGSTYVGLFGYIGSDGTVSHLGVVDSYFAGDGNVGGVCGYILHGTISGCYSMATVSSTKVTSGVLVGYNSGTVQNSFAYGTAQGSARSFGSNQQGTMTNCFYLKKSAGTEYYVTGTKEATADQFRSGEVAYQLGSADGVWQQKLGEGGDAYPRFYPNQTNLHVGLANGEYHNHTNVTECNICQLENNKPGQDSYGVYLIADETQLKWFSDWVNNVESNAKAKLTDNITVTSWTPIGNATNKFTGTLDGNGKTVTISSMANNADYAGLVGYLGSSGKITNIKVAGTVTGGNNVGGVVGYCLVRWKM